MDVFLYSETIKQFFNEESGKLKYSLYLYRCPVCGKQNSKHYLTHHNFDYSICRNCSFVYANPRLEDEGAKIWYNSDFYNAAMGSEQFRVKEGDTYYSSSLSLDKMNNVAECLLNYCSKDSLILDFGCGIGSLLLLLKEGYGFNNVKGIDLNGSAVRFAREYRKLDVVLGDAKTFADTSKFDVVLSIETIEHMNDLNAYGDTIRNLLKPGGMLLVTTPYNDPKARVIGGVLGDHYMAPNHINFFSKNIVLFLSRYGLTSVKFKFWHDTLGIGTVKARYLYSREWATATAPLLVNHGVFYPKSYKGDIRAFVRTLAQDEYESGNNNTLKKRISQPIEAMKWLIRKILSVKVTTSMLVVFRKE